MWDSEMHCAYSTASRATWYFISRSPQLAHLADQLELCFLWSHRQSWHNGIL